jgi:hypothetical protein
MKLTYGSENEEAAFVRRIAAPPRVKRSKNKRKSLIGASVALFGAGAVCTYVVLQNDSEMNAHNLALQSEEAFNNALIQFEARQKGGSVDAEESVFSGVDPEVEKKFELLDTDHNGLITETELYKGVSAQWNHELERIYKSNLDTELKNQIAGIIQENRQQQAKCVTRIFLKNDGPGIDKEQYTFANDMLQEFCGGVKIHIPDEGEASSGPSSNPVASSITWNEPSTTEPDREPYTNSPVLEEPSPFKAKNDEPSYTNTFGADQEPTSAGEEPISTGAPAAGEEPIAYGKKPTNTEAPVGGEKPTISEEPSYTKAPAAGGEEPIASAEEPIYTKASVADEEPTSTKALTDKESTHTEAPVADKEPTYSEALTVGEEPIASREEPTYTEAPATIGREPIASGEERTYNESPVDGEEPIYTTAPVADKEPTYTESPVAGEEPIRTTAPVADKEPTNTEAPVGGEKPTISEEPSYTEAPAAGGEEPIASAEEPTYTEAPEASGEERTYTKSPVAGEEPIYTTASVADNEPTYTEAPVVDKESTYTEVPVAGEEQSYTKTPNGIEGPIPTGERPSSSETPLTDAKPVDETTGSEYYDESSSGSETGSESDVVSSEAPYGTDDKSIVPWQDQDIDDLPLWSTPTFDVTSPTEAPGTNNDDFVEAEEEEEKKKKGTDINDHVLDSSAFDTPEHQQFQSSLESHYKKRIEAHKQILAFATLQAKKQDFMISLLKDCITQASTRVSMMYGLFW